MRPLPLGPSTHLLVLTGAGISAESGIPTFRDAGGLWEGHRVEEVASPEGFAADPRKVWRFYSQRRRGLAGISPNLGHRAVAEVERRLGDRFLLVTQNVDTLHSAAGSERVIELHGNLMRTRCSSCSRQPFHDSQTYDGEPPACDLCAGRGRRGLLRPDIVWFGEAIDRGALSRISRFLEQGARQRGASGYAELVFLAIGTSGQVYPAAGLVQTVKELGGRTYLANLEESDNGYLFDEVALGKASEIVPALLGTALA